MDISKLKEKYSEISDAALVLSVPVLWGDMDSANHVNNLIYLRWTETARIQLFEKMMDTSFKGDKGPILGWHDCKYIFPLTYPDTALVTMKVIQILMDRFMLEARVYSQKHQKLAAISMQSIIPYDYTQLTKIELPEEWKLKLDSFS